VIIVVTLYIFAVVPLLIWLYLLMARGGFWRVARQFAPLPANHELSKKLVVIIPARNEAPVIGDTIRSLLQQDFAGSIHVVVIDDGSTDGTDNAAADAAAGIGLSAQLTVISGAPLPAEWSGKVWAMSQGVAAASGLDADYLLFTDADIHHDPDSVATLLTNAEARQADLVSWMVKLHTTSRSEQWLIPAFVYFFLLLYPPAWIASLRSRVAGAAGGCMLIRPSALERIGGLRSIHSQIIDDCALARVLKGDGGAIWLGLTRCAHSTRRYGSVAEIGRMVSRTAFNQLRHSYLLLTATMAGLLATFLLPPLLLLSRHPLSMALGAAAWVLMSTSYVPMLRFYGLPAIRSLGLPAVALFYAAATINSAVQYSLGRGGQWKGRIQDHQITADEPHA
jgi:hopene-associated glycosyltransferase HpnB